MADGRASGTVLLWLAIILCFMTLYFVISWIPKLSIEAGLSPKDGIYAGAIYNIGAFVGTSSVGLVAMRFDLRRVIFAYMVLAATALMIFGTVHMPLA
jgi:cyanate permease